MFLAKKLFMEIGGLALLTVMCIGCDLQLEDDPYAVSRINGLWKIGSIEVLAAPVRSASCALPQSIQDTQRVLQSGMNIYVDFVDGTAKGYCQYKDKTYALEAVYTYTIDEYVATFNQQDNDYPGIFRYIFKGFAFDISGESLILHFDISFLSGCGQNQLQINTVKTERNAVDKSEPINDDILNML